MSELFTRIVAMSDGPVAVAVALLLKLTALLAVAWLVHAALRRCNPRWRVFVWRSVATGTVVLCGLAICPPLMPLAVLPVDTTPAPAVRDNSHVGFTSAISGSFAPSRETITGESTDPASTDETSPRPEAVQVVEHSAEVPGPTRTDAGQIAAVIGSSKVAPATGAAGKLGPLSSSLDQNAEDAARSVAILAWVFAVWCGGVCWRGACMLFGLMRLRRIRDQATSVPEWIENTSGEVASALGLQRRVELRQSADVQSPCLIGAQRPLILLPRRQCDAEYRDELPAILAHELAHAQGRDLSWNLALNGLSTLFWFHPLAWRVRAVHADDCDAVADAVAADYIGDATTYGRTLARLTLRISAPEIAVGLAMAKKSGVQRRIEAIREQVFRHGLPRPRVACAIVVAAALIVLLGGIALTRSQAEPAKPPAKGAPATDAGKPAAREESKPAAGQTREDQQADKEQAPENRGRMTIRAVAEATGQALEGVEIKFNGRIGNQRINTTIETNAEGIAEFEFKAGTKVQNLWFVASAPNFVPINYNWRSERREIELQDEIELRFDAGIEIGGVVQDESGRPIAGAKIDIRLPNTWPKLDNWVFTAFEATTDKDGRWKWNGAPQDMGQIGIGVSHPDYISAGSSGKKGLSNAAILKQGLTVTGRVTDGKGQPIPGAKAQLGTDRWGSGEPNATTDADGRYVIKKCNPGASLVTVQADGFSPQFKPLTVGDKNEGFDFKLGPGHTLRVRIVDSDGKPLPGTTFAADTWRGYRSIEFRASADAEGVISWPSAPADVVLCDLLKQGYMSARRVPLTATDEVQVVKLSPPLVISGRVTAAASGKPIDKFQLREGSRYEGNDQIYWSGDRDLEFENGTYTVKYTEPAKAHVLQVVAPGYLPLNSREFSSIDGTQSFDFALKPGSGSTGIVVLADETPVAGADVLLATKEKQAQLDLGRVSRHNRADVAKTDGEGRFSFLPQEEKSYWLVAVHDAGFAQIAGAEFEKTHRLTLTPWGRVEGRVLEGANADPKRLLSLSPKWTEDRRELSGAITQQNQTITDDEGRFAFERVVPGHHSIARVLVFEFNRGSTHHYDWATAVEVEAGATAAVTIGGIGRPVIGRIVLDRKPEQPVDWSIEPVSIKPWTKAAPRQGGESARYLGRILKSGRFRIPDVPPGDYLLHVSLKSAVGARWVGEGTEVATARFEFAVPEISGGRSDAPLDLGDIKAVVPDTLDVGELAPDFVAENLAEGTLRLSSLRGKVVLLDFLAIGTPETTGEMENRSALFSKWSENPRFAMVSLVCNQTPERARQLVEQVHPKWPLGFAGPAPLSKISRQYGVRTLPAIFLIGPHGRVLAKNVRGDDLDRALAAALTDEKLFAAAAAAEIPPRFPITRFEAPVSPARLKSAPAVVVLDDTDPSFETDKPREDRARLLSSTGEELWSHSGFNACQTVGGVHGVAIDRQRGRIYVRENVTHRLTAFTLQGQKLWRVDEIEADTLAVDEQTGHLWCSGGPLLNAGQTVVFDPEGKEVATYPYRGVDLAFDPHDGAIWLVGHQILKLSRKGDVLFRKKVDGWCCTSVSVNRTDGSVWIAEQAHSDRPNSKNRLWLLNADGSVRRNIELGEQLVFVVECDPKTGDAWIGGYKTGLRRVPIKGDPGEPLPIEARNISISPTTGDLWVTTEEAVLKLDAAGKVLIRSPFGKPSSQSWLEAF